MAQMGTGANRLTSGNASDSYSLMLDEHKDIIYDKGGHNLVAVMLPEGVSFSDVCIGKNSEGDSFSVIYRKTQEGKKEVQLQYTFSDHNIIGLSYKPNVQLLFKESTVINKLQRPSNWPWDKRPYPRRYTPTVEEM